MAIKEKALKEFLVKLAHRSGASDLGQEVEALFKKEPKVPKEPKVKTPETTPVVPKVEGGSDAA